MEYVFPCKKLNYISIKIPIKKAGVLTPAGNFLIIKTNHR